MSAACFSDPALRRVSKDPPDERVTNGSAVTVAF